MQLVDPSVDEAIHHRVRAFLKGRNSAGGKPMEALPPQQARQVLTTLQASAKVELPPALVSSIPILHDGQLQVGEELKRRLR